MTTKIIEALEKGTAPWQKTWSDTMPINAVTGNYYQGINSIILSVEGDRLSQDDDPRSVTKKQAESKGWSIKDGAKPTKIFVLILPKKMRIHSGFIIINRESIVGNKKSAFRKTFEVYHASQIRCIVPFVKPKHMPLMNNEVLDKIVFYSSARIFEGGNEAYYSPRDDLIRMPYRSAFTDTESYYSTLFHELAVRPDRALLKVV